MSLIAATLWEKKKQLHVGILFTFLFSAQHTKFVDFV